MTLPHTRLCLGIVMAAMLAGPIPQPCFAQAPAEQKPERELLKEQRKLFLEQTLTTAKPFSYIFNSGDPPRVVWRDVDTVRELGADGALRVRWFDAELNEVETPDKPGRWGALIEGVAPNGTPVRRAMTFYARPEGFFLYLPQDVPEPSYLPGPILAEVWAERRDEFKAFAKDSWLKALNDSEQIAVMLAWLAGTEPLGRAPLTTETAKALDDEYHLQLKLKALGLEEKVQALDPPRQLDPPAPALRQGTAEEAGMQPNAATKIREVCRAWAEDSGEPFVTLVARHGVIVVHEAFGQDADGQPLKLDFRHDVASITKSATAILFSRFIDQGLIALDDPVSVVFPDYPDNSPHVPTFRQCLTHTSGLSGHGSFGGVRNAHLDNVILNGIDANEPGKAYTYSGMGFDLVAEAMEIITGKSALRLYRDHLYQPLGIGDVPMENASAGARFTAYELGVLAQWLANRGSYGDQQFITPETFEKMLPEQLGERYPGIDQVEGIGMHWMHHPRPPRSPRPDPDDPTKTSGNYFSNRMVGHGSLTACIFLADLDTGLVITQVRKAAGPRHGEWSTKFFAAISDGMLTAQE